MPRIHQASGRYHWSAFTVPVALTPLIVGVVWLQSRLVLDEVFGWYSGVTILVVAVLMGYAARMGLRWTHSRSTRVNRVVGAVVGAWTLYLSWLIFLHDVPALGAPYNGPTWVELANPVTYVEYVFHLARWGWYEQVVGQGFDRVAVWSPHGLTLWVPWILEAIVLVAIPATLASKGASDPYCERCGSWFGRPDVLFELAPTAKRPERMLMKWDLEGLAALKLRKPGDKRWYTVSGALCSCKRTGFVRMDRSTLFLARSRSGVETVRQEEEQLTSPILVTRKQWKKVLAIPKRIRGEVLM